MSNITKCLLAIVAKVIVNDHKDNDHTIMILEPVLSQLVDGVPGDDLQIRLLMTQDTSFSVSSNGIVYVAAQKKTVDTC